MNHEDDFREGKEEHPADSENKCARAGCDRPKYQGQDFCLACIVGRRAAVRAASTCDNLDAVGDEHL